MTWAPSTVASGAAPGPGSRSSSPIMGSPSTGSRTTTRSRSSRKNMAPDEDERAYRLFDVHDVSLGNDGEDDFNTVVLDGAEVVLPLEMDIDGDPLQDDTVSLRSVHGLYEQTLTARSPDVTA